jgi:hypothetical protein
MLYSIWEAGWSYILISHIFLYFDFDNYVLCSFWPWLWSYRWIL